MDFVVLTLTQLIVFGLLGLVVECLFTGLLSLVKGDPHATCQTFLIMIPVYAILIPMFIFMEQVRLLNTIPGLSFSFL